MSIKSGKTKFYLPPANKRNLAICFILSLLVAFLFDQGLRGFSFASADSSVVLSMDSVSSIAPGSSVDLNIYADPSNAPKQPSAIGWDILYNPADVASIAWKADGPAAKAAGKSGFCSNPSSGKFRCGVLGLNSNTISKGTSNGNIGTITVTLTSNTSATTVLLQFSNLQASDASGNLIVVTGSGGSIGVKQSQANTLPAVSITAPVSGATVSGSAAIAAASATAQTGATIVSVKFYLDGGSLLGTASTPPYSISWDTTAFANGNHNVTAQATDSLGQVGTSAGVVISVLNNAGGAQLSCQATTPTSIAAGDSVTFFASNGQSPYTLTAVGSSGISGLTVTYNASGSYQVSVTDSAGHSANCGTVTVTGGNGGDGGVCLAPTAGTVTAPTEVDPGQVFTVSCDFGVANAYIPTPTGCDAFTGFTGTAARFSCTAPNGGAVTIMCQIQNQSGHAHVCSTASAFSQVIHINNPKPTTYTATVTKTATVTCASGATSSDTETVTATSNVSQADAQSKAQTQALSNAQTQAQAKCPAPAQLSCQATTPTSIAAGDSVTFFASNGQSPYTLTAVGSSGISGLTVTYNASGSYQVSVTDSAGHSANCGTVTVSQPVPTTFTASATATASASATANCSGGTTASATKEATASASATSNISQADAQSKAQAQAQNNAQAQAQSSAQIQAAANCPAAPPIVPPVVNSTGNCSNGFNSCNTNTNNNNQSSYGNNSANQDNQSISNGNNSAFTQTNGNCANNSCNTGYSNQGSYLYPGNFFPWAGLPGQSWYGR